MATKPNPCHKNTEQMSESEQKSIQICESFYAEQRALLKAKRDAAIERARKTILVPNDDDL